MAVLGLDTSNYAASLAVFDGRDGVNVGRLLSVRPGELGLRQSDALFQHVRQLPALFRELGGFPELPIMEDYELSLRLRRRGVPLDAVVNSFGYSVM